MRDPQIGVLLFWNEIGGNKLPSEKKMGFFFLVAGILIMEKAQIRIFMIATILATQKVKAGFLAQCLYYL